MSFVIYKKKTVKKGSIKPNNSNFKSLTTCERRNKGNFTLKSNSNKKMLCGGRWGGGGVWQDYLFF